MKTTITVTGRASYHHMPDYSETPSLTGLTLREALKVLRDVYFGDLGGMYNVELSDGTYLFVELTPASERGTYLMNSQSAIRFDYQAGRTIRTYKLA